MGLLERERIAALVDVRAFPGSRRYPHFDREQMHEELARIDVAYHHAPQLGGRRKPPPDAEPTAWRNASFHAYATWMRTPEFGAALAGLVSLAREDRTVIMCSEAVPWRCHRNLIADALAARGHAVLHIGDAGTKAHALTSFAVVDHGAVRYPAESAGASGQLDLPV